MTTKYIKVAVTIADNEEWKSDLLSGKLIESGYESCVETEQGFDAYITEIEYNSSKLEEAVFQYSDLIEATWKTMEVPDINWNTEWEKNYFKPLVIAERCVIRAPFHKDYPRSEFEIVIEPNMAFGTGNHETTSMMLEWVLELDLKDKSVLDMGCGTGILAILASMRGAAKVTAIDIDEWSFKGTKTNAEINQITNIEAQIGGAEILGDVLYDCILANIQRNVLLNDMEKYTSVLNTGGTIIMSGYYHADNQIIIEKARLVGLLPSDFKQKNNWISQSFIKS